MIVLTLTNSPSNLSCDLTKWMIEIDNGVYVGNLNARVRDAIWDRVCNNIGMGKAVMVYSVNNEQKMQINIHNSERHIEDYDGLWLVKRPLPVKRDNAKLLDKNTQKRVEKTLNSKNKWKQKQFPPNSYVILDLETTGLDSENDEIIEVGLIKIVDEIIVDEYSNLICSDVTIPEFITDMTGINSHMLVEKGVDIAEVLHVCFNFISTFPVVCFNANFDKCFMIEAMKKLGRPFPNIEFIDARTKIKKAIPSLKCYKLSAISNELGVSLDQTHRALADCKLLFNVISKLNNI